MTTDTIPETFPSALERNARILELHEQGCSERQIARIVGCSRTTVWTVVQATKGASR